jgi:uncharacterized protein YcbK (DUF882 family)
LSALNLKAGKPFDSGPYFYYDWLLIFPLQVLIYAVVKRQVDRRCFIKVSVLAAASAAFPRVSRGSPPGISENCRSLSFYNTHTLESLEISYWEAGRYVAGALEKINHIMRDHRTDEIKRIEPRLLDLLFHLKNAHKNTGPFQIISGYRSPHTNALLRMKDRGVAKNSLHMYGQAVDIRLPGCPLSELRQTAVKLKSGGVGYYPSAGFVHVDVGRCRYW